MKGLPSLNEQFDLQFYAESMPIGGFFPAYIGKDQHPLCHLDPYCGGKQIKHDQLSHEIPAIFGVNRRLPGF